MTNLILSYRLITPVGQKMGSVCPIRQTVLLGLLVHKENAIKVHTVGLAYY